MDDAFKEWDRLHKTWVRPRGSSLDTTRYRSLMDLDEYLVKGVLGADPDAWIARKKRWPVDRFDPGCAVLYRTYDDPFVVFTVVPTDTPFGRKALVQLLHFSPRADEAGDLWARVIEPRYRVQCSKGPWP